MYVSRACAYTEGLRMYILRELMPQSSKINCSCRRLTSVLSRSISSLSFLSGLCAALCLYISNSLRSFLQGYTDIHMYYYVISISKIYTPFMKGYGYN